ncbi:MAG TPA: alpha/beta hydrolase [Thermoanaerobaculia bacterium]|nr:alpha/beta hydrolase [Thermoanaerobaculia bacterium]
MSAKGNPRIEIRAIQNNGLTMRIAEAGEGPLVLLVHGWPELGYSWRHQLPALAEAGYHAVAPDMRGYGGTDAPPAVSDYDIHHLCDDLVGLIDHFGQEQAVVVGHDWGAIVAWTFALLRPERTRAVAGLSVPYRGRGETSLIDALELNFGDRFFYILYFQEPGIAEAEFDADPRGILERLYASPGVAREVPPVTDPRRAAGGWISRLGQPKESPPWLLPHELDYYVQEFTCTGFRGGINYYRNFHRNWETTPQLAEARVEQPALFIAGERDMVIAPWKDKLEAQMRPWVPGLRGLHLLPGAGHWVQQERPQEVNDLLIDFFAALEPKGENR